MSAAAPFAHPSMSSIQGTPTVFLLSPHPASHGGSRHLLPQSQLPFQSSPQVPPPPQHQRASSSTSSPFPGWHGSSSSVLPPARVAPPAAGPSSFYQHPSLLQQHPQGPPSRQPPLPFPASMSQSVPPLPPQAPQVQAQPYYGAYSHPPYGPPPTAPPQPDPPKHNSIEMNRTMVMQVLDKFSEELPYYFDLEDMDDAGHSGNGSGSSGDERVRQRRREGYPSTSSRSKPRLIRLTVHGGACMLLHPGFHALSLKVPEIPQPKASGHSPPDVSRSYFDPSYVGAPPTRSMRDLARRTSTRDIDILLRGFVADFGTLGPPPRDRRRRREGERSMEPGEDILRMDAATRLKACIKATARYFSGLGLDWMNADADVSLPMAADPKTHQTYDPIHLSTWTEKNTHLYTIYTSPNRRLILTSVPPYWLLALKISRWGPRDWVDIGIILRYGTLISRTLFNSDIAWTGDSLRKFLEKECWPMGYQTDRYDVGKMGVFVKRCEEAAARVKGWEEGVPDGWPEGYLDQNLLDSAVQSSGAGQMGGAGSIAQPPLPPAVVPPPSLPEGYVENVRDWARKSQSRRRRTSSSRRRSRSRSRRRRKEEEEEERFRKDGPFVPPGVEFDHDGYVVADQYPEELEERRGRARPQQREARQQQQAFGGAYQGYSDSYPAQQTRARHSTGHEEEPVHSSWITDSMARARISSPVQDISKAGPVDPSLASLAWHPRARGATAPAMSQGAGRGMHSSSTMYHRQPSLYSDQHQAFIPGANRTQQSQDRQRSMQSGPSSREQLPPASPPDHGRDRPRALTYPSWRGRGVPEFDDESGSEESEEDEEVESDADSLGRNAGSESDESDGDKENRGRMSHPLHPHSRANPRTNRIYAPPTPHPAVTAPAISRGGSSQSRIEGSLLLQPPSMTHLPPGTISSRNAHRTPSPNPPKRRPPPLNISPPPEPLPGPSHGDAGNARNNLYPASTNVHPAYFGSAHRGGDRHQTEPFAGSSQAQDRRSHSRRPSPNPLYPPHPGYTQVVPPANPAYGHHRQPLSEAQPELPPLTREARAAQLQFEEQKRQWEQEQRWSIQQMANRRTGWP